MRLRREKSIRRLLIVPIVMAIAMGVMTRLKGRVVQKCMTWCRGHMGSAATCSTQDTADHGCAPQGVEEPQTLVLTV